MERRYQVFISSTFLDLKNARQEVSQALLRASCFPAGMELFPAADEEQFEFIKSIIDMSDYYLLISAGRYGSLHPKTKISYTEMEYDYAVEQGKPIIRLLHRDPFRELKGEFIETNDAGREKLEVFREKLSTASLVRYWSDPKDLLTETVFALQDVQRRKPAQGWVRGDRISREDAEIQIARLHQKVAELELLNAQIPKASIDVSAIFSDIEGDTLVKIISDDLPNEGAFKVEGEGDNLTATIPTKDLCWALATAMTIGFVDNEIVCDAIRILWARETKKWIDKSIYVDDEQLGFQRAFAFLRERRVAKPTPVTGFTERKTESAKGLHSMISILDSSSPTFSKRVTWSLSEEAAVSASNCFVKITERTAAH